MPSAAANRRQRLIDLGFETYLRKTGTAIYSTLRSDGRYHHIRCEVADRGDGGARNDLLAADILLGDCVSCAEKLPLAMDNWGGRTARQALMALEGAYRASNLEPGDDVRVARAIGSMLRHRAELVHNHSHIPGDAHRPILDLLTEQLERLGGGREAARTRAVASARRELEAAGAVTFDEVPVLVSFPDVVVEPRNVRGVVSQLFGHCSVGERALWVPRFASTFVVMYLAGVPKAKAPQVWVAECETQALAEVAAVMHMEGGEFADLASTIIAARDVLA